MRQGLAWPYFAFRAFCILLTLGVTSRFPVLSFAEETIEQLPEHIRFLYEKPTQMTWYAPKSGPVTSEVAVYPSLGISKDGKRRMALRVFQRSPNLFLTSQLYFVIDQVTQDIQLYQVNYKTRCRASASGVEGTLVIDDQDSLIRRIAHAGEVSMALVEGGETTQAYKLSPDDLENFQRIVTLYGMVDLPPVLEAVPGEVEGGGYLLAGFSDLTEPKLIHKTRVKPRYPEIARRSGVEGPVILLFTVHKDGTVGDIRVQETPAGGYDLEEAAIEAVKKWRYHPALADGKPVDAINKVTVDYYFSR